MGQKQAKLKQDALAELLSQTSFSETELCDWYKGFLKEYPSGSLNLEDFKRVYAKYFPYGESSRFAEYVFRAFNRNHTGVIDFREFISAVNILNHGNLLQKLHWVFTAYDLDGDGFISRQDMSQVLTSIYSLVGSSAQFPDDELTPFDRGEKIFHSMDCDRDDLISWNEFLTGIKSNPVLMHLLHAGFNMVEVQK